MSTAVVSSASSGFIPGGGGGGGGRTARRKQRCWLFQVDCVTSVANEAELLASVRERYTTVKRLVVRPAPAAATTPGGGEGGRNIVVEVQFTGPQPSEGPGALLCDLLHGTSVQAKPVELPRGRKKRARTDASSEASDSDAEDGASRKMGGHRSATNLGRMDEEEEDGPGGPRCTTAPNGGSPMGGGKPRDSGALRRNSTGGGSGGAVVPSAGLGPLSSTGIFTPSSKPATPRAVVPADDGSGRPAGVSGLMVPPQQHRTVSDEHMRHPSQQQQQQQQAQQQQYGKQGAQWEDVVQRMSTPQNSNHSLEAGGSVDLSSNGSQPTGKPEYSSLIGTSNNSGGTWNSNDSQSGLLGPMPPPQPAQLSPRDWSFESSPQVSQSNQGNMVVDLSDVVTENLFPAGAPSNDPSPNGSNGDAAAGRQQEEAMASSKWSTDGGHLPMEKVQIEPSRNECDFEGRPSPTAKSPNDRLPPIMGATERQCHLVFTGLDKTGHDLRSPRVTAHFGVDAVHKVGKVTNPIQMGANGRAFAGVFYPSMQEIWPELYSTSNIRVVEVDLVVEIRSESGEYQYVGPQLKVTYVRGPPADIEAAPRPSGRRTASRAPIPYNNEDPQVSYSCVDYSCGDWFSDMCSSVFHRNGATTQHQPLPDDPNDLMNVDP